MYLNMTNKYFNWGIIGLWSQQHDHVYKMKARFQIWHLGDWTPCVFLFSVLLQRLFLSIGSIIQPRSQEKPWMSSWRPMPMAEHILHPASCSSSEPHIQLLKSVLVFSPLSISLPFGLSRASYMIWNQKSRVEWKHAYWTERIPATHLLLLLRTEFTEFN